MSAAVCLSSHLMCGELGLYFLCLGAPVWHALCRYVTKGFAAIPPWDGMAWCLQSLAFFLLSWQLLGSKPGGIWSSLTSHPAKLEITAIHQLWGDQRRVARPLKIADTWQEMSRYFTQQSNKQIVYMVFNWQINRAKTRIDAHLILFQYQGSRMWMYITWVCMTPVILH